jgi:MinD superfamily P-loop ATPase
MEKMIQIPQIDTEKCDGCGLCVGVCRCHVISLVDGKATIIPKNGCSRCHQWCTLCEDICPNKAISCAFDVVIERKKDLK